MEGMWNNLDEGPVCVTVRRPPCIVARKMQRSRRPEDSDCDRKDERGRGSMRNLGGEITKQLERLRGRAGYRPGEVGESVGECCNQMSWMVACESHGHRGNASTRAEPEEASQWGCRQGRGSENKSLVTC